MTRRRWRRWTPICGRRRSPLEIIRFERRLELHDGIGGPGPEQIDQLGVQIGVPARTQIAQAGHRRRIDARQRRER